MYHHRNHLNSNFGFIMLVISIALFPSCRENKAPHYPKSQTPEESLKSFQFADSSFKMELFASEPLVEDPVSMVFDDQGDAYVVEMSDANMPDSLKGRGQIIQLKDLNRDGKADTAIVFATGIKEATTLLPWKGGLIVTAAPNIWYFKDTDGDGKADQKDILFSGFFTGNDEAQISSLRYGVDNWIYADNTGFPGKIVSHLNSQSDTLQLQGADFRFRLDTKEFERTSGPGQYGLALDDWGHRFFTKNSIHITQVVIPIRYLERNPYLDPTGLKLVENISDHDPIMFQISETPYWRQIRTERRNKASREAGRPENEFARDHFTGASGGTFYGGNQYGEEYYGSVFVGEVSGNLIHRDVLTTDTKSLNPYYVAQRPTREKDKEFISTKDTWFRPTNFELGPDGNLYVVDMYRQHIETPVSIPDDLAAQMNFAEGSDKGRLYRIVKKEYQYNQSAFNLNSMTSLQLVDQLKNPNRWWRQNAHRILIERQDKSVIDAVKDLWESAKDGRVRIQALYVLEGLEGLDKNIVAQALTDPEPGIRENGAILAERFPPLVKNVEKLTEDSSVRVSFQATLSIGSFQGQDVVNALFGILRKFGTNEWFRTAVLTADAGNIPALIREIKSNSDMMKEPWVANFLQRLDNINKKRSIN